MNTPRRTIRIEDDIWLPAKAKADEEGTTVTDVIRKALHAYVKAGAVVVLAALALSACNVGEQAAPGCNSGESVTIEVPGPRGFVTSDEWCTLTAK